MEIIRTEAENGLIEKCKASHLEGPAWFTDLQQQAGDEFVNLGLPHRRVEEWKYTDLKSKFKTSFPTIASGDAIDFAAIETALGNELSSIDAYKIVIVDGEFNAELSDSDFGEGVEVLNIKQALINPPSWLGGLGGILQSDRDAIQALNLATMQGGVAIEVVEKTEVSKPIHLIFVNSNSEPSSFTSRLYFDFGAASKVELIESHISLHKGADIQANIVTEVVVGNWARIRHVKLTTDTDDSVHLANVIGKLGKESDYGLFQFTVNGGITRNQVHMRYEGSEAKANISGVALLKDNSHADMTLIMDHAAIGCESREMFKTVLDGHGRAVFQGKVIVQPGAQKTDGEMMSKAMLLSDNAEFDSKPELEIYADDVLCGHGATTGKIDEDLLFYLKARGITDAQARALLIQAFVGEALELVENDTIRDLFIDRVVTWYEAT